MHRVKFTLYTIVCLLHDARSKVPVAGKTNDPLDRVFTGSQLKSFVYGGEIFKVRKM